MLASVSNSSYFALKWIYSLVESLIYTDLQLLLPGGFVWPLNLKIVHKVCRHTCTLKCIVYLLPFSFLTDIFFYGVFYNIKACLPSGITSSFV